MTEIVYSCFAEPPYGIKISAKYLFGKDTNGYFCSNGDNKIYLPVEEIRMLFSPIKGNWDSIIREFESESKLTISNKNGKHIKK